MKEYSMRLTKRSSASPETLFDCLADLSTHTTWGGAKQWYNFRLLSLAAPPGPATVGTSFASTGTIPMSLRRFEDHSRVTVAQRPHTLEFVTDSLARRGKRSMAATYRHRYEIAAAPDGSEVIYTMTQLSVSNPFLRLSLPGVRNIIWRVALPIMAGRGFRNLLAVAARRAKVERAPQLSPQANR